MLDPAAGADDRVARADYNGWIGVDRTRARFEVPREAVVQAREMLRRRFAEVQVGEEPPQADRGAREKGAFESMVPTFSSLRTTAT